MATVLHICFAGNQSEWSDPDEARPVLDYRIIRDGEDPISDTVQPTLQLKALGLYRLPSALNADARAAVEAHADTTHGCASFSAVYFSGGWVTV